MDRSPSMLVVILIILAGIVGGVVIVFFAILVCRYCYKRNYRNKRDMKSPENGTSDFLNPHPSMSLVSESDGCGESTNFAENSIGPDEVSIKRENGTDDDENVDHVVAKYRQESIRNVADDAEEEKYDSKAVPTIKCSFEDSEVFTVGDSRLDGGQMSYLNVFGQEKPRRHSDNGPYETAIAFATSPVTVRQHSASQHMSGEISPTSRMSSGQRRRSSAFLKPYDTRGVGGTKHSLSLEIVINRDKMSPDRKVRSFDFELSLCHESEDGGPPCCTEKRYAKVDLDRDSDSSPSVVRFNDMGSLEEISERQQMLDELVDVDYGRRVMAPSSLSKSVSLNSQEPPKDVVAPSVTDNRSPRERYLAVDVWHLRASIAGEESMTSQGLMREERRKSAQAAIKSASIDVANANPSSTASALRCPNLGRSTNFLQIPHYEAKRQNFRDALHRRHQRSTLSGETSLDSYDTDPSVSDRGHTTTSFDSTTDNTDSTGDSHGSRLQMMQRDSGYKSLETPQGAALPNSLGTPRGSWTSQNQANPHQLSPKTGRHKLMLSRSMQDYRIGPDDFRAPSASLDERATNSPEPAILTAVHNQPSSNLRPPTPTRRRQLPESKSCEDPQYRSMTEHALHIPGGSPRAPRKLPDIHRAWARSTDEGMSQERRYTPADGILRHKETPVEKETPISAGHAVRISASTKRRQFSKDKKYVRIRETCVDHESIDSFDDPGSQEKKRSVFSRFFSQQVPDKALMEASEGDDIEDYPEEAMEEKNLLYGQPRSARNSYDISNPPMMRDYSIDEKTNEIFNEFIRNDPALDNRKLETRARHKQRLQRQHESHSVDRGPNRLLLSEHRSASYSPSPLTRSRQVHEDDEPPGDHRH